jgi:hypothetical protein
MAVADIFENGAELLVSHFLNSACLFQSVYQISSKSDDNWPTQGISLIFKMAAAAIFENGATLPVLFFFELSMFVLVCLSSFIKIGL